MINYAHCNYLPSHVIPIQNIINNERRQRNGTHYIVNTLSAHTAQLIEFRKSWQFSKHLC